MTILLLPNLHHSCNIGLRSANVTPLGLRELFFEYCTRSFFALNVSNDCAFFFPQQELLFPNPQGSRMVCSALTDSIRFGNFFLEAGIPRTFFSSPPKVSAHLFVFRLLPISHIQRCNLAFFHWEGKKRKRVYFGDVRKKHKTPHQLNCQVQLTSEIDV